MESEVSPGPFELVLHTRILFISDWHTKDFGVGKSTIHLVWYVLSESFGGRLWSFETPVPGAPFGPVFTFFFRAPIPDLGVQLLGGCDPGDLWLWGLNFRVVLSQRLLHSDALKFSLPARLLTFNSFVMTKMFDIFGVVVGFVGLGLRCRMELFYHGNGS